MDRPVLMLVSSREGEEAALLAALAARRSVAVPSQVSERPCQIMVVPRHPQRVFEVAGLFREAGFSVSLRSEWTDKPSPADVWVGDTMGELTFYYAMSDVALLGGSFERFGGQNLIESAACGCPLVMGPHTFNFAEAAKWAQEAGAARSAPDMRSGVELALQWMDQTSELTTAGMRCLEFAGAHQGASRKSASAILALLGARVQRFPNTAQHGDQRHSTQDVCNINTPVAHRRGAT